MDEWVALLARVCGFSPGLLERIIQFQAWTFVQRKTHGNTQSHTLHESETTDV